MKFNRSKYRMLVKNNPKKAEEYIKQTQGRVEEVVEETELEALQEAYVERFGKRIAPAYKNNVERIKGKLAE